MKQKLKKIILIVLIVGQVTAWPSLALAGLLDGSTPAYPTDVKDGISTPIIDAPFLITIKAQSVANQFCLTR